MGTAPMRRCDSITGAHMSRARFSKLNDRSPGRHACPKPKNGLGNWPLPAVSTHNCYAAPSDGRRLTAPQSHRPRIHNAQGATEAGKPRQQKARTQLDQTPLSQNQISMLQTAETHVSNRGRRQNLRYVRVSPVLAMVVSPSPFARNAHIGRHKCETPVPRAHDGKRKLLLNLC